MQAVKLILAVGLLSILGFYGCGDDTEETTKTSAISFSTVNPILTSSCAGSTCHSSGSAYTQYVDSQTNFDSNKSTIKERLNSSDSSLVMPKPDSGLTLSSADKQTLIDYIDQ